MGLFENYNMQGFAPADEVPSTDSGQALLFRGLKTILARARPPAPAGASSLGASASAPNQNGSGTRCAQTALAKEVDSVLRLRRAQRGLR